jgi:hypothetical protein
MIHLLGGMTRLQIRIYLFIKTFIYIYIFNIIISILVITGLPTLHLSL